MRTVTREITVGDMIIYKVGQDTGRATVREIYTDLLATGDRWYLTNGKPRWVSHSNLI